MQTTYRSWWRGSTCKETKSFPRKPSKILNMTTLKCEKRNTRTLHTLVTVIYSNISIYAGGRAEKKGGLEITRSDVRVLGTADGFLIIRSPNTSLHSRYISGKAFFLPLTSFMVLKPIKDVLAFNLAVLPEFSWDFLNLISSWRPNSIVVIKILQDSYLLSGGSPPGTALPAQETVFTTAPIFIWQQLVLLLLLLMVLLLLGFHDRLETRERLQREANKTAKQTHREREREQTERENLVRLECMRWWE